MGTGLTAIQSFQNMSDLVTIDGCQGEGGGQMVRSSMALAVVTGRQCDRKHSGGAIAARTWPKAFDVGESRV